ncbi:MAG: ATP-dependent RecD-like DNA helicase [Bacillus sp. (in: Bacteria)]|nr:ATP-dependent RecD-like DNA helicase [Bacillus sp. (in: firmicutes)]
MERQQSLIMVEQFYIKGRPIATIFHNEENLYTVLRLEIDDTNLSYEEKEVTVIGNFPKIHEQETYTFFGVFHDHPKFGLQFKAHSFQKEIPTTKQGIIQYLSSDLFKGIGKKTAQLIVDTLGEQAISKIVDNPDVLKEVPRLSKDKADTIIETLLMNQGLEQVMMALNKLGFGSQLSLKIYQVYKDETLSIINQNPYQLVEDIEGIGFTRADELGRKMGIEGNHPARIKAACLYSLEQLCLQEGHVYIEAEDLLKAVKKLLEQSQPTSIEFTEISREIIHLAEEGKLIVEEQRLYLPSLYFSEKGIVRHIQRILSQTEYEELFPQSEFLLALGELEERIGIQYAPSQREAIQTALMSPMMILTGGPGTGKTTVIKGIVELYCELHGLSMDPKQYAKDESFPIVLAAPTGRAAKRMSESTGIPALTIHRLLGWNGLDGFEHDEERPIQAKLLIVDEMSMVDTWLANQLFKALPDEIQVVLVGDEDQLPSVGPGQVLKDLLDSKLIPTVRLTDIYRQKEGSTIIELAHQMKNGVVPENLTSPQKDRSFIKCSATHIADVVKKVVENALKKGYTKRDIQVLAPMYRGPAGIDKLNELLQSVFNPNEGKDRKEIQYGDVTYRIGDKVLQLVNQPDHHVFNGDMGEIVSISYAKENTEKEDMVIVSFDGNEVTYTKQELNQITLAYCCSIHKSQGSEFPIVILPVVKSYYRMLRRKLLYTAVTRSKRFLIICGEEEAFRLGVSKQEDSIRKTTLKEKLKALLKDDEKDEPIVLDEEALMKVDPMIGMENVTPYDFMEKG